MQIQSLRIQSYPSWCVDDKASPVAIEQLNKLELYRDLKAKDCDEVLRL